MRLSVTFALTMLSSSVLAATAFPESPPEAPEFDTSFLRQAIPAEAITVRRGSDEPAVRWDRDGDGKIELWGDWDRESDQFGAWTTMDPVTELPSWRVRVSHRRQSPYEISWDTDNDGQLDWTALDSNRDGKPEEILWHIGGEQQASARFIDRDGDGRFEARCWIDLAPGREWDRVWAFDEDDDGSYEHAVDGGSLTENGYDPAWAEHVLDADSGRQDLRWDLIGWYESQADAANFRRHVIFYASDRQGDRVYELTYRPMMRRLFYTDRDFKTQVLDALRGRAQDPQADYGTLWALGELLRWQAAPPEVHPAYLQEWRETIGLPASAELPTELDPDAAEEADIWFKQSLATEEMSRAARENIAVRLSMLYAVEDRWDLVHSLCDPMLDGAARVNGPISARHLEVANMALAYGNLVWARGLYSAMAAHWQVNPSDPDRAQPNHIALNRLGILALNSGSVNQARYFLIRALDSLSPQVKDPDTTLARMLLEHSESENAAREYMIGVAEFLARNSSQPQAAGLGADGAL